MSRTTTAGVKALVVLTALGLGAAACGSSKKSSTSSGGGAAGSIKIGYFGALTGPNAQLGINAYNGEKLAIDQFNQKNGNLIDLVKYDSQSDPAQAPQLAQKVISDKTVAVVGPLFSGESKVSDPIFEQAGVVNVTASATNPKLAQNGWKYFHRAVGNDNAQGPAAAKYIMKKLNAKTVAVVDDNEEYSLGIGDIVRSTFKSANVNVVFSDHIDQNAQDYSATVNKIKTANPDAIFYGGYYSEGGRFLKQLRDAGVTAKFVSDDGANDPKLITTAGASAAEGALLTCPCGDITGNPSAAPFVSAYTAQAGNAPGTYSGEAYDAANVILAAIKAGNKTSAAINDYLKTVSYTGLTKTIKFDAQGEVQSPTVYVFEVKGGKVVFDGSVDQLAGA